MKAKLIKEAVDFKRGQPTISGLDVWIQRSDNPDNFANAKSYMAKETNEEYLNKIMEDLLNFHQSVAMDMSPHTDDEEAFQNWPTQNIGPINRVRDQISSIENALEGLIEYLKTVKR